MIINFPANVNDEAIRFSMHCNEAVIAVLPAIFGRGEKREKQNRSVSKVL
jgi:hypothetical protein